MARYKKYEHLPWWLNNLNDNTLTPAQKEVLDLDYYCKKHGTRLSHQRAAERLDRGRQTVYYARRRLEDLGLRNTEPAKGSFLIGHPIEYANETEFLTQLEARQMSPRRSKMERKSLQKKRDLQSLSSSEVENEAGQSRPAGESRPQAPAGSSVQGAGANPPPTADDIERREKALFEVAKMGARNKLLDLGHSEEKTDALADARAHQAVTQRRTRKK
jgi:hypothetical protein